MRHFISGGGAQLLLGERGGAASAFAAEAALSFLRGVVQRPCHGPHNVHEDGSGVVADEGGLAVALATDLVSAGWREAAAKVFVEEHLHAVALDKEGVVLVSLLALHPSLAGLVAEGPVGWAAAQLRLSTRHCSSVLPKRYLCPTFAAVPPLTPPRPALTLFLRVAKHLTSLHTSSPPSPARISTMSTTWPSLKSLNCLVLAPFSLSPSTVCVVATAAIVSCRQGAGVRRWWRRGAGSS
eukprot:scaffold13315_cov63-Phaeocystis_antarctica.AAC.1